jgi:iron donor protein CyaY
LKKTLCAWRFCGENSFRQVGFPATILFKLKEQLMSRKLGDAEFQTKSEAAINELEKAYANLAEERDIDVEVQGSVLSITFEEGEPGKFIVSANSSAGQVWVSARVSSFKFDWSDEANAFVLAGTGESIKSVMQRLTQEQLGDDDVEL